MVFLFVEIEIFVKFFHRPLLVEFAVLFPQLVLHGLDLVGYLEST
jgi:hypothetical protein